MLFALLRAACPEYTGCSMLIASGTSPTVWSDFLAIASLSLSLEARGKSGLTSPSCATAVCELDQRSDTR
jgi:hypothetical protein